MNTATTTPEQFFTRLTTHLCTPTFVFLTGLSMIALADRVDWFRHRVRPKSVGEHPTQAGRAG